MISEKIWSTSVVHKFLLQVKLDQVQHPRKFVLWARARIVKVAKFVRMTGKSCPICGKTNHLVNDCWCNGKEKNDPKSKDCKGHGKDDSKKDKSQVKCFSREKFGHCSNKCFDKRNANVLEQ